jgi:uncharacterized protein (TIGR00730 family)
MGQVADAALAAGAHVLGVIPEALQAREVAHLGLPDLRVVSSMHERKALMAQLADAFVALPGGAGTLEEFFEVWTWALLGIHRKPCGILNVAGYFDGLLAFIDHSVAQQFVRPEHRAMVLVDDDACPAVRSSRQLRTASRAEVAGARGDVGAGEHGRA